MTKTVNKFLAVFLAVAMVFGFSVIGFAETDAFDLKSGSVVAVSGKFKDKYVKELKITVNANSKFALSDGFSLNIAGTDGQNKTYNASNVKSIDVDGKTATIVVSYEAGMTHEAEYTVTIAEGSFKTSDENPNAEYAFTTTGNLILENLNGDRPSTTMQRFISWLASWEYADLIRPIINLLKWFDSL